MIKYVDNINNAGTGCRNNRKRILEREREREREREF